NKIKTIAFPGMGTGIGGVDKKQAARVMVEEIKKFPELEVILVAFDDELYEAFKEAL
ncbi:MAG: macro domain-containing protein, partial [Candidatus Hydrothermarchaeota archaeon]